MAMTRVLWVWGIVLAAIVTAVAWSVTRPNYRELKLADGTIMLGSLKGGLSRTAEIFSVRLEDAPTGSAVRSRAQLHIDGRDFLLGDLTPADLRSVGVEVRPSTTTEEQSAFVGYGDQNREGGLEFRFSGGRLRAFYARCHLANRCDFELSWPPRNRFRLPISESHLSPVLDSMIAVRDYSGH